MARVAIALAPTAAFSAAGCAHLAPPPACALGENRTAVAQIAFGRNNGERLAVDDAAWERFVEEEIARRFPAALTVVDTQGRWMSKGVLTREPGKMVTIILADAARDRLAIAEIAAACNRRFDQDAVLTMVGQSRVAFREGR